MESKPKNVHAVALGSIRSPAKKHAAKLRAAARYPTKPCTCGRQPGHHAYDCPLYYTVAEREARRRRIEETTQ